MHIICEAVSSDKLGVPSGLRYGLSIFVYGPTGPRHQHAVLLRHHRREMGGAHRVQGNSPRGLSGPSAPETRSGPGKEPGPDRLIELLVTGILVPLECFVNTYMDT